MRQARSQLGSREAVASMAKTSRPRPEAARTGRCSILRRNASTSDDLPAAGSLSRELVIGCRAPLLADYRGGGTGEVQPGLGQHGRASGIAQGCPPPALALNKLSRLRTATRTLAP